MGTVLAMCRHRVKMVKQKEQYKYLGNFLRDTLMVLSMMMVDGHFEMSSVWNVEWLPS